MTALGWKSLGLGFLRLNTTTTIMSIKTPRTLQAVAMTMTSVDTWVPLTNLEFRPEFLSLDKAGAFMVRLSVSVSRMENRVIFTRMDQFYKKKSFCFHCF